MMHDNLEEWPDCCTPHCTAKVCTWGSESLCYPHEERLVGTEEMTRRFNLTHEHPRGSKVKVNYMTHEWSEVRQDE